MTTSATQDAEAHAAELASALVESARRLGASDCDACVGLSASVHIAARDGAIDERSRQQSRSAGVRVLRDGRIGFATSADVPLKQDDIDGLVRQAMAVASLTTASPTNVFLKPAAATAADVATAARLQRYHDDVALLPLTFAEQTALSLDRIVRAQADVSAIQSASVSMRRGTQALATSSGFISVDSGTSASISAGAVVDDGGKKQVFGEHAVSRDLSCLGDVEKVALAAADGARRKRGAAPVASGQMAVIFEPAVARGLLAALVGAMQGDALVRRQSFLSAGFLSGDKVRVFAAGSSITDDPHLVGGFASRVFDGEAQRCAPSVLVDEQGMWQQPLLDARSAARLGKTSTAHAWRSSTGTPSPSANNVTLIGGHGTLSDAIRTTSRGLWITSLLGQGPNPTTGDYSRGAAGFLIENGEVVAAVEDVTIAGSFLAMLTSIDFVGHDLDVRSALRAPTVRIPAMQVGGR